MRQIRRFSVEGLFSSTTTHKIVFSEDSRVTILSGPNGVGKTHILRLIHAVLSMNYTLLLQMPFQRLLIQFADGKTLAVDRQYDEESQEHQLRFEGSGPRGGRLGTTIIPAEQTYDLLSRFESRSDGMYQDLRTGRLVTRDVLVTLMERQRRFPQTRGGATSRMLHLLETDAAWIRDLLDSRAPIFIDTKRLDTPQPKGRPDRPDRPEAALSQRSRIDEYIEQVKVQVADARRASLAVSQEADQNFAARVLRPSRKTIGEEELRRRYEIVAAQTLELHRSGLTESIVDVEFPSSGVDPTERRVLSVFIDDWGKKLSPLLPVNEKLKTLQRIVNDKFIGKRLRLDKSGALVFFSDKAKEIIPVHLLSSGEQHILALFTMLLFSAQPGSVVLIDEPEISLHAAWKHAFVEDITDVASIADLQIILATHSSGIINGKWDLVQELGMRG